MKTIVFAAAALVIATGSSFARGGGSDHFEPFSDLHSMSGIDGSQIDSTHTSSLKNHPHTMTKRPAPMTRRPAPMTSSPYNPADDYGQGIWGR
jgi:hypothetical protein